MLVAVSGPKLRMKHFFTVLGVEEDAQEVIVSLDGTWSQVSAWFKVLHMTQNDAIARRKGDKAAMNVLPLQYKRVHL